MGRARGSPTKVVEGAFSATIRVAVSSGNSGGRCSSFTSSTAYAAVTTAVRAVVSTPSFFASMYIAVTCRK